MSTPTDLNKSKAHIFKKITSILSSGTHKYANRIAKTLAPEVDRAIEQFFKSIVPLMGHEVDLNSQISIPGLSPWRPLSLAYIKQKNNAAFFLQTSLQSPQPFRRSSRSAFNLLVGRTTLIETISKTHGWHAFGNCQIIVKDYRNFTVLPGQTVSVPPEAGQIKFTLEIRPWGTLKTADLSWFEAWLELQGIIDPTTFIKLTNPRGTQRPLLRAWLAHYSDVVIPDIIEAALRERFKKNVHVRVTRPFAQGSF